MLKDLILKSKSNDKGGGVAGGDFILLRNRIEQLEGYINQLRKQMAEMKEDMEEMNRPNGNSGTSKSDEALIRELRESLGKLWEDFMKHKEHCVARNKQLTDVVEGKADRTELAELE